MRTPLSNSIIGWPKRRPKEDSDIDSGSHNPNERRSTPQTPTTRCPADRRLLDGPEFSSAGPRTTCARILARIGRGARGGAEKSTRVPEHVLAASRRFPERSARASLPGQGPDAGKARQRTARAPAFSYSRPKNSNISGRRRIVCRTSLCAPIFSDCCNF